MKILTIYFIIGLMLFPIPHLVAQKKSLELIPELATMKSDSNRVNLVLQKIWEVKYEKPSESLPYIVENIALAKKINFTKGIAESYKLYGVLLDETGQIVKSIEAYQTAQVYYRKINDELGVAKCMANIGILYRDQRRHVESIEIFKRTLKTFDKFQFDAGSYTAHLNLSIEYSMLDQPDKAMFHINQAENHMRKLGWDESNFYGNKGNIYLGTKDFDQAIHYFQKAIDLGPNENGVETWLDNLARCYTAMGNYSKAVPIIEQAIKKHRQIYSANSYSAHHHLARAYYKDNQLKKAYQTLQKALDIRDSIFSLASASQLSDLSKKYETEKKALQIQSLKKERTIQNQVIKSESRLKVIFATGMVLFLILGLFLYKLVQRKRKDNQIISEQKAVVEQQKDDLTIKNQEILDSITYAKRLQDAILPAESYWKTHLPESFILYKPKDIVAGDFYWMEHQVLEINGQQEEVLFFAAADCTGHGVPGALVSVICCNALNRSVLEFRLTDPGRILDKTRELVIDTFKRSTEDVKDGMDISLGCFHVSSRKLLWSGANNPLWIFPPNTDELEELKPQKEPIGLYDTLSVFKTHELILEPNTVIYLFTDGFADQFGGVNGKKFKYKNFKEQLTQLQSKPMSEQLLHLDNMIETWRGDLEQVDDICVIGIRL